VRLKDLVLVATIVKLKAQLYEAGLDRIVSHRWVDSREEKDWSKDE